MHNCAFFMRQVVDDHDVVVEDGNKKDGWTATSRS